MAAIAFEREFLGLAKWYLVCRLQVMGGKVEGSDIPDGGLGFSLLGMLDQEIAMQLLCSEARGEPKSARREILRKRGFRPCQ
jgi:hypothetical protein